MRATTEELPVTKSDAIWPGFVLSFFVPGFGLIRAEKYIRALPQTGQTAGYGAVFLLQVLMPK